MRAKPTIKPRRPPTADSKGAFVGGNNKRGRATVHLPEELMIQAQHLAVDRRQSFSALVEEALRNLLAKAP